MTGPRSIDLYHVLVPLEEADPARLVRADGLAITWSSASRSPTARSGYGEGVPRSYVTGETIEIDLRQPRERSTSPGILGEPGRLRRGGPAARSASTCPRPRPTRGGWPATRPGAPWNSPCSTPTAAQFGESVGEAVRMVESRPELLTPEARRRSATAGRSRPRRRRSETVSAWKMWLYGFHQVKVKVGVAGQDDPARLRDGSAGSWAGGWTSGSTPTRRGRPARSSSGSRPLLPFRPSVLEQPVPHAEVDALAELRPAAGRAGDARRVALRLSRRGPGGRAADGRPLQRPALEVRRDRPVACGSSAWPSGRGWASSSAATPARRACSRRRAGTSRATSGGSATSKGRTTATSWPRT